LIDDRSRSAIITMERWADKATARKYFVAAGKKARAAEAELDQTETVARRLAARAASQTTVDALGHLALWNVSRTAAEAVAQVGDWEVELSAQADLLREVVGNPFRSLPPPPEAVAPLAERIYGGEWDLMPILGEWLQEHGYWTEGEHCLDPSLQHVKGCWVIDWVTGRE
jgi:hypothetical protein